MLTRNILNWQRLQKFRLNVHFILAHFGLVSVLTSHPTKYPNNQVSEGPPSLSGSSFICNKHVLSCHTTNIPQYDVYVRVYCTNRHIYLPFTCYIAIWHAEACKESKRGAKNHCFLEAIPPLSYHLDVQGKKCRARGKTTQRQLVLNANYIVHTMHSQLIYS